MTSGGRRVLRWTCPRSALQGSRWRSTPSVMRASRSCEMHRTCFFSANGWNVSFRHVPRDCSAEGGEGEGGRVERVPVVFVGVESPWCVCGKMREQGRGLALSLLGRGYGPCAWRGCVDALRRGRALRGSLMALRFVFLRRPFVCSVYATRGIASSSQDCLRPGATRITRQVATRVAELQDRVHAGDQRSRPQQKQTGAPMRP